MPGQTAQQEQLYMPLLSSQENPPLPEILQRAQAGDLRVVPEGPRTAHTSLPGMHFCFASQCVVI